MKEFLELRNFLKAAVEKNKKQYYGILMWISRYNE
tara:strand:+ start:88 stop:192 length:105 start_codon:yes stop_codon:yes gene_type:complete